MLTHTNIYIKLLNAKVTEAPKQKEVPKYREAIVSRFPKSRTQKFADVGGESVLNSSYPFSVSIENYYCFWSYT